MKVLVVTPTYGRLPFLGRLVASFLSQTYEDKELVIINDDVNVTISCDEPNVICINMNKKILIGQKRNIAIQIGFHDLYMHLDDDDIFLPERISNHVKIHQEHPEINLYRNTASYTIYGDSFIRMPVNTPNFVSYKRRGWFEMGENMHNINYAEDLYFLENMKNVLEEDRPDQLDSVYNFAGINYHAGLIPCWLDFTSESMNVNIGHESPRVKKAVLDQIDGLIYPPNSLSLEDIAKNQLIEMNVFKGEFKIIPDFEQFNNFIKLDKKYKEINHLAYENSEVEVKLEHISLGKIKVI